MQPTICSRCKKRVAVVFITKLDNGETHNEGLCLKCAKELGMPQVDVIDNTNVYFANNASADVQKQSYILIAQRRPIDEVRTEAIRNGISAAEAAKLVPDTDENALTPYEADGNVTVIVKFWREDGQIWCAKATESGFVQLPFATGHTRYPSA